MHFEISFDMIFNLFCKANFHSSSKDVYSYDKIFKFLCCGKDSLLLHPCFMLEAASMHHAYAEWPSTAGALWVMMFFMISVTPICIAKKQAKQLLGLSVIPNVVLSGLKKSFTQMKRTMQTLMYLEDYLFESIEL